MIARLTNWYCLSDKVGWKAVDVSVWDYLDKYAKDPEVKLITWTEKNFIVKVLIKEKRSLECEHVSIRSLF